MPNSKPDAIAADGSEIRLLATPGLTRASLCEVTLPAGQISRPVWHRTVQEICYFLEGQGQVWRHPSDREQGYIVDVGPGDVLTIPTGCQFQFRAGSEPLRFLCYTSPPWPGPDEAQPAGFGGLENH